MQSTINYFKRSPDFTQRLRFGITLTAYCQGLLPRFQAQHEVTAILVVRHQQKRVLYCRFLAFDHDAGYTPLGFMGSDNQQMSAQILVVEDESGIRELINDALDGHGYDIVMCNNALTARTQLAQGTPDLAIVDWMMPQVSGIELIASMRKNQATGNLPIIMLTARSAEDDTIQGLDAGADDYITKPFSPRELHSRVQAALRRSAGHNPNSALKHGNITVHPESLRVTVDDEAVSLGQTEFKLLHFLISNPDRVFSREQLLDNVWGVNSFVEERTVDVHILRLRKALKAHDANDPVETVRGAGYRLAAT